MDPERELDPTLLRGAATAREPERAPAEGAALCLSGGGYRAMLFHLGAIWRLNELALLRKEIVVSRAETIGTQRLVRISSVSGGSIIAGLLGLKWKSLTFDGANVATNLGPMIVEPIRAMARTTIDVCAILKGKLLPWKNVADEIAAAYRKHLFSNATLEDLPADSEGPRFVINAT